MEIFELRYFLSAAEFENVNKAASKLSISPPAISRAISRLEDELGVQLFERVGRNIVLSSHGKSLQREASRIVGDLDEVKAKFKPSDFHYSITISGTEFGLSAFLSRTLEKLKSSKYSFQAEVKIARASRDVERMIAMGEAQIGLTAQAPSENFKSVRMGSLRSRVYLGEKHPLFTYAKSGREVDVDELLKHEFAGFVEPYVFDLAANSPSPDGWRDDKLPRKLSLKAESIEAALRAVESGLYLIYLPEAIATSRNLKSLKIVRCPYKCETEIFLLARKNAEFGWLKVLF